MYQLENKKVKNIFQINALLLVCALFLTQTSWAIDFQCTQTHLSPAISLNNSLLTNTYLYLYQQNTEKNVSLQNRDFREITSNISPRRKIRKREITEGIITGIKKKAGYPLGFIIEFNGYKGFAHRNNIYPFIFSNLTEDQLKQLIGEKFDIEIINPGIPGEKDPFVAILGKNIKQTMLKRYSTHKGKLIKIIYGGDETLGYKEDIILGVVVIVRGIKCFAYADKIKIPDIRLLDYEGKTVDVKILKPAIQGKDPKVMIFDREAEKEELTERNKHIAGTTAHKEFHKKQKPEFSTLGEQLKQALATKPNKSSPPINLILQAI